MNIGIVNDMAMARVAIAQTLAKNGKHRVLWSASNVVEAVAHCQEQLPDLVLMDLVMPGLNGVQATREIMHLAPTAILVVTASVDGNCALGFQAMGEGALDVIATPALGDPVAEKAFLKKIDQIDSLISTGGVLNTRIPPPTAKVDCSLTRSQKGSAARLVTIGCSAGGPAALAEILSRLPSPMDASVVIVQHIDAQFTHELANWLNTRCSCPLRLAEEGDRPEHGTVLLADTAGHLEMLPNRRMGYTRRAPEHSCCPSVDVFFDSVARYWNGQAFGAILTGMGRDGARGLLAMKKRGFITVAQDQASSAIYGMPKAAAACGAAGAVLPLNKLADRMTQWIGTGE